MRCKMGRLIDADEVEKKLEKLLCEPDYQHAVESWSVGVNLAQSAIYDISTAFDVEDVVKQIKEFYPDAEQYGFSGAITDIIEIVRRGGVK